MSHPATVPHSSHAKGARDAVGVGNRVMHVAGAMADSQPRWADMSNHDEDLVPAVSAVVMHVAGAMA